MVARTEHLTLDVAPRAMQRAGNGSLFMDILDAVAVQLILELCAESWPVSATPPGK